MVNDQFVTTRIENPELIKSLQVLCKGLLHETIEIDGSENLEELKQALQGLVRKTKARSAPIQDLALEKGKRHRIERQEKEGRSLSQIGTWEFDFTYNYLTWSPELYKLFEIQEPQSQKNLLEAYRERIHPDDRMTLDSVIAQSEKNCEKYDFEHRLVFERGRTKYIRGTGKVYKDEGGRDLRLVGTAQDISEERLARNLFRETEKLWKFALEGAGDGVWDWSIPDGHTFFSKHLEEMLGYAEGQMNPNVEELKKRLHPDDEARILADLGAHLAGERIYHNEHRILCKDGSYKWMLARGMIVSHGTNGDPLRMVGTYTDISRIKDAERKLVQASKLASLGEMAAGIAHEINNPLAIISGSIELLTKVASHPEKLANKIMVMEKSCERISRIVKGLKKFSRSS